MTSKPISEPLTFKELDGLALAAAKGRLAVYGDRRFHVDELGPWLELRGLDRADISTFVIDDEKRGAFDRAVRGAINARTAARRRDLSGPGEWCAAEPRSHGRAAA